MAYGSGLAYPAIGIGPQRIDGTCVRACTRGSGSGQVGNRRNHEGFPATAQGKSVIGAIDPISQGSDHLLLGSGVVSSSALAHGGSGPDFRRAMVEKRKYVIRRTPKPVDIAVPAPAPVKANGRKPKAETQAQTTEVVKPYSVPGVVGVPLPGVPEGEGPKAHADVHGVVTVVLDPGSYRWLCETAEGNLVMQHVRYGPLMPEAIEAGVRAVNGLRSAEVVLTPPPAKPKRGRRS
jgi:hypothetical protein